MNHRFLRKKILLLPLVLFLIFSSGFTTNTRSFIIPTFSEKSDLYTQLELSTLGLQEDIFNKAISGWNVLKMNNDLQNDQVLSIVDLSQSSRLKRLYIIDLAEKKILFNTYVAHGRNSGEEFACSFSNQSESLKSSLGFYLTGKTYSGAHGLSLKLKGLEKGINDIAEQRGIVMHGADYVSENFSRQFGRLGRSQGCPAIPEELCMPIVNSIKDGSCLFIFYPDSSYLKNTRFL